MPEQAVVVSPATSANLGPGFDCLGLAVALYNRTTVTRLSGSVSEALADPRHPMVEEAASLFFSHPKVHSPAFPFSWSVAAEVPLSRGLGSSVALRLGIFEGLNALVGGTLDKQDLFDLCNAAEGHPDNAGPGVWGGFFLSSPSGALFRHPLGDDLLVVVLIPEKQVNTEAARAVLPEAIPRRQAVKSAANASCLAAAFLTGDYAKARGCFEDFLHQPYRRHLVPGLMEVISAAQDAGALGGYLSGSGSTIASLCLRSDRCAEEVRRSMERVYTTLNQPCRAMILEPDNEGVHTLKPDA